MIQCQGPETMGKECTKETLITSEMNKKLANTKTGNCAFFAM